MQPNQSAGFSLRGASPPAVVLMTSRVAFAGGGTRPRFVFIILRGALDGLTAVPPYGDPRLRATARRGCDCGARREQTAR